MRKSLLVALTGAFATVLVGGCSKEPSGDPESVSTEQAGAPASATASPEVVAGDAIPASLHGRWGLVPADCTSSAGDAKGLLTISENRLRFYESVAELETVQSVTANSIEGKFAFSGEGQEWMLDVSLSTVDGQKLVRRDTGPDAMPTPLTYTRCT